MISIAIALSTLCASADSEDGITDVSDGRNIIISDMAVEGDQVYLVAHQEEGENWSVQFRFFNGTEWQPWMRVCDPSHLTAGHEAVAVENGTVHIVYYARMSIYRMGIFYRTFYNGTLSPEVRVDQEAGDLEYRQLPDVDVDGGVVHVVWSQFSRDEPGICYRRFDQTGWAGITTIGPNYSGYSNYYPKVAAEGTTVHTAWYRDYYSGSLGDVVYRQFSGTVWTSPVIVTEHYGDGEDTRGFDLVERDGRTHIVWDRQLGLNSTVYHLSMEDGVFGDVEMVSPDRDNGTFDTPSIAVEGEGIAVVWRSGRFYGNTTIGFRYFNGTAWGTHQTLGGNLAISKQYSPTVVIELGRVHVSWTRMKNDTYSGLYWNTSLEGEPPSSEIGPMDVFWIGPEALDIQWTAEDDYLLGRVSLYHRYSKDNISWSGWTYSDGTTKVTSPRSTGNFTFVPRDGDGFYQFQTRAEDLLGNEEFLSLEGDWTVALDTVAPTGSITILGDTDGLTARPDQTLGLTYHDEMTGHFENATGGTLLLICVSQNELDTNRTWTVAEPEIDLTLEGWDGTKTIWMQVMDLAGLVSPVYSTHIVLDTTPPNGTILIAEGAHKIASSEVQLDITFLDATSGVVSIRLSSDGVWDDEVWRPAETPLLWTLEDGEGSRSVFLQVLDRAGWVSETAADHVVVDLEAPFGNVTIVSATGFIASRNVMLVLEYDDNLSEVSLFRLSNDGSWSDEDWREPTTLVSWTLEDGSGSKRVHLQLMDEFGHVYETFSDEIILDLELPSASIMIVGGEDGVNSLDLELRISYWDATTSVERMRLNDRDEFEDVPWLEPSETRIFRLPPGDGWRSIYIQVMDSVGHVSKTQWDDVLVDTTSPMVTKTNPLSNETLVWTYSEIFIIFSEPMNRSSVGEHLHLTTGAWDINGSIRWSRNDTMVSFAPYQPLDEGTRYQLELGTGATDPLGNPLMAPLVIEFETEGGAQTEVPPEEGADMTGVMILLIVIAIAVNVVLAVMLMRTRRRPRRPSEDAES